MSDKSPISKRLKESRTEAHLSQKKLGIAAGIDEFVASARLNQYETGKHTPNYTVIRYIARVLNVPEAYFYADDDNLAELIKAYGTLGKRKQKQLIKYANELRGDG